MTSKIDLSKYVGKKVRVTFINTPQYSYNNIVFADEGIVELTDIYMYPYRICGNLYTEDGKWKNSDTRKFEILTIEELQMNNTRTEMTSKIDLSKYVGKKVRVTFRNTVFMDEGIVELTDSFTYPYRIRGNLYSKDGKWKNNVTKKFDILTIEEIQMNNYQELENKVKELQAEIDRLKAQELKSKSLYEMLDDFGSINRDYVCDTVKKWLPPDDPHDGEEFQLGWNACLGYLRDKIK